MSEAVGSKVESLGSDKEAAEGPPRTLRSLEIMNDELK